MRDCSVRIEAVRVGQQLLDYIHTRYLLDCGVPAHCPQILADAYSLPSHIEQHVKAIQRWELQYIPDRFWISSALSPASKYPNIPPNLSKVRCRTVVWYFSRHTNFLRAWH